MQQTELSILTETQKVMSVRCITYLLIAHMCTKAHLYRSYPCSDTSFLLQVYCKSPSPHQNRLQRRPNMFLYQCSIIDKTIEKWSQQSTIDINAAHIAHIANINEFKETVYSHNVCMSLRMCKLFFTRQCTGEFICGIP